MAKIKVTADTILQIMTGIMKSEEINNVITDTSAPDEWINKTVQEALNVEYYTFKHRPMDTEQVVRDLISQGQNPNSLLALTRSFCLVSLNSVDRVFSKKNDIITVSAHFEYWLNIDKVKLLENLLEDISIETTGERIPITVGQEKRKVLVAVGSLGISEIEESTEFGKMTVCEFDADLVFYPDVISISDYEIEMKMIIGGSESWVVVPVSGLSLSNSMTQKPIPLANNTRNVGSINLSRVKSIVLTFDGYNNAFVNDLCSKSLAGDETIINNNIPIVMKLTRKEQSFIYNCVIKEHTLTVQEDTGNEVHSLILTTKGVRDGIT